MRQLDLVGVVLYGACRVLRHKLFPTPGGRKRQPSGAEDSKGGESLMAERIHALLVDDSKGPLTELEHVLDRQGVQTMHARNCAEAAAVLGGSEATDLIFTDTTLPD